MGRPQCLPEICVTNHISMKSKWGRAALSLASLFLQSEMTSPSQSALRCGRSADFFGI